MLLSIYSGLVLTLVGCVGAKQLLMWMKTPEEVLPLAVLYLRIYFLGMTAMMVYNFGSAIMRAVGDTRRPLYFLAISGVINVALNLLFVVVFRLDVAGVAIATVVSQCISAFLIVRCMMGMKDSVHLELSALHIYRDKFRRILTIGLPASFQGMLFSFSNVIIQSSVNSFGAVTVAGNSAAANIEGFVYVAMNAFHQAAISFTSQNIGAAKYGRVNRIVYTSQLCVIVVGTLLGNVAVLFGRPLLGLYTTSAAVVEAGMIRLGIICRLYALCGMMDVMVGILRGLGYSVMPMFVSLVGACGLRLLWVAFVFPFFGTPAALYISYPISWAVTAAMHAGFFFVVRKHAYAKVRHETAGVQ